MRAEKGLLENFGKRKEGEPEASGENSVKEGSKTLRS